MKTLIKHKLRKTRSGGYAERDEHIDASVLRFGRGAECEVHMPDPRIKLHHAEIAIQAHGPVLECGPNVDAMVNGEPQLITSLKAGDKVTLGPYDLIILNLEELAEKADDDAEKTKIQACDIAFTLELVRPLGDDLEKLKERSDVKLTSVGLSIRGWAWCAFLTVLAVALVAPISSFLNKGDIDKQEILSGELRPLLASADRLWKSGPHSGAHGFFGDKCEACHREPFVQVQNEACIGCHLETAQHADPVAHPGASLDTHQCQSCHKEHREEPVPLTTTHDSQCRNCHQKINVKFEDGHPFGEYPYKRRTRIHFNHVTHFDKYFQDPNNADKSPSSCRGCHEPDGQGKFMVIGGFEQNCGACHGPYVADKPFDLIDLPGIDPSTLEDHEDEELLDRGWQGGEWPINAEAEELPEAMMVLLSSDEEFMEAWTFIQDEGVDMFDFSEASEEELAAAETVAKGVKRFIHGALSEGKDFLIDRLEDTAGTTLSDAQRQNILAALPLSLLQETQTRWFPNLFEEMEAISGDDAPEMPDEMPDDFEGPDDMVDAVDWASNGGWYIEDYTVRYKLHGHNDPIMKIWLTIATSTAQNHESMEALTGILAAPNGPGGCIACHSVDQINDDPSEVNWKSHRTTADDSHSTDFFHARHFTLVGDEGCANCHEINKEAKYSDSYSDWNPADFDSNFAPIKSETCAQCHHSQKVATACTDCHNFHTDESIAGTSKEKISMK